jgi:hypothetical protein
LTLASQWSGTANGFGVEGRDFANLGSSSVGGPNNLTIATGLRYKYSANFQTGLALESPLAGNKVSVPPASFTRLDVLTAH